MKIHSLAAGAILFAFAAQQVCAEPEIAVAIRYLQAEGVSHSQLLLYREDGKLLRQLTQEKSGQVMSPVFAPDGSSIIFKIVKGGKTEFWSVAPKGGNLHQLDAVPEWYRASKNTPYFTDADSDPLHSSPDTKVLPNIGGNFPTPDGTQELVLQSPADDPDSEVNGPGHGKHFLLRDLKTKESVELGKVEGFLGLFELLHIDGKNDRIFLMEPPLRVAFFGLHLGSTDGDTVFALDLNSPRLVSLSPNWATPVPLPGEAAFLVLAELRYQPIPDSGKTANGSCLSLWDSNLKQVRYARENSATICYGASMYRPEKKPAVITIGLNFNQQ